MRKVISTRTHGMLDYLSVGALLALPRLMGWSRGTTELLTGSALATLAYSAVTDYEWGVVKALPMQGHLAADSLSAATLLTSPLLVGEGQTEKLALLGLGLFEATVTLLSESHSPTEDDENTGYEASRWARRYERSLTPPETKARETASLAHA